MRIGIHDAEGRKYPNLALMKLSAWHKSQGDAVEWYLPLLGHDLVYSSQVFSFTRPASLTGSVIHGGTGYGLYEKTLPDHIEHICPDYLLYGVDYSLGFLTRGCSRSCPWCIVPHKEGGIRPHADITEFVRHRDVRLMDNNILAAPDYAAEQFAKIAKMNLRVDFNQGLDARLIDRTIAKRLAKLRWWKPVRLACDRKEQMKSVAKAVRILRENRVTPKRYSCYLLVKDIEDAHERVKFLLSLGVDPYAQPYRDPEGTPTTQEQREFATWVNRHYCKVVPWEKYDRKLRK